MKGYYKLRSSLKDSCLKDSNIQMQYIAALLTQHVVHLQPPYCDMFHVLVWATSTLLLGMCTGLIFNTQHVTTG